MAKIVDDHVLCEQCLYDLFGLARDGVCPECGYSIDATLCESLVGTELNREKLEFNERATREQIDQEEYERRARKDQELQERYEKQLDQSDERGRRVDALLDRFERLLASWERARPPG